MSERQESIKNLLQAPHTVSEVSDILQINIILVRREIDRLVKRGYVVQLPNKRYSDGRPASIYQLKKLVVVLEEKKPTIDFYSEKLSTWLINFQRKNSTLKDIPDRVSSIMAYNLKTKLSSNDKDYELQIALDMLQEIEDYLIGLAGFIYQYRTDADIWNLSITSDLLHAKNNKIFEIIEIYNNQMKTRIAVYKHMKAHDE